MRHNQKGFTLPELLIGLAISSIIIAASFGSYIVIKNNYDFQKDMKNISQSSRAVATMIMRDVRLAGYNFDDGPTKQNPVITTPVKITDGGTTGSDSIEVIYDQSITERLKISYYAKPYPNTTSQRSRLYKKVERCDPSVNCSAGSLVTVIPESPIADYVEDFQLIGSKNGNTLGTGAAIYGQGNKRWITPTSIISNCNGDVHPAMNASVSGRAFFAIDGNLSTTYFCSTLNPDPVLTVKFANKVRIEKVRSRSNAYLGGGSVTNYNDATSLLNQFSNFKHPFALAPNGHSLNVGIKSLRTTSNECTWSSPCTSPGGTFGTKAFFFQRLTDREKDFTSWDSDALNIAQAVVPVNSGIQVVLDQGGLCDYRGGTTCNNYEGQRGAEIAEIAFYGEVYGELQDPQEVEISILIRSPEQHGSTPIAQTWNIGNRPIATNDNYIRDVYSISTLVRNKFYD